MALPLVRLVDGWRCTAVGWAVVGSAFLAVHGQRIRQQLTTVIRALIMGNQPTGFQFTFALEVILQNGAAHLWSFANAVTGPADNDPNVVMPARLLRIASSEWGQAALVGLLLITLLLFTYRRQLSQPLRVMALGNAGFGLGVLPFLFFEDRLFMRYGYFAHAGLAIALAGLTAVLGARLTGYRPESADPARVAPAGPYSG